MNSLLKKCRWRGEDVPCHKVFQSFPTDRGLCCVFNIDSAEKIFKDSYYRNELIRRRQEQDSKYGELKKDFEVSGSGWLNGKHQLVYYDLLNVKGK